MADPLSAISLAACIIQFVDYGFKFVSTAVKIYRSTADDVYKSEEQHEIGTVVRALQLQTRSLSHQSSPSDPMMARILESCAAVSSELEQELSKVQGSLKVKSTKGIGEIALAAVRVMMKSNKIKELEARFIRLREQLVFHLTATLYEHRSSTETALAELIGSEKAFHHATVSRLERIIKTLESLKTPSPLKGTEDTGLSSEEEEAFSDFATMFTVWAQQRKAARMQAIIKSLEFPQITDRETSILNAHRATFEWAFNPETSNLVTWLSEGSGIYWVSGKAGSGKSTLLKFLMSHPSTEELLETWAGDKVLVTASHFFWAQGTPLQKSYRGLLQTLICQILMRHPDQVPTITPTRWTSWTDIQPAWSVSELWACFTSLVSTGRCKVCLFIDGLDEYQGDDNQELIDSLKSLTASEDIKICASSRPWVEFTTAFGSGEWKLEVQDLTFGDISRYSRDKLKSNSHIGSYGQGVDSLAQEISVRAQGVFLWVYLVVRSLIRGMRHMDTIADLWERLNELPSDLEEYFRRMLNSIEPIYAKRTARVLRVLSHTDAVAVSTKPVITFYFLDLEMKDPEYFLAPLRSPTSENENEYYGRIELEKGHQLVAQCRDLVHVSKPPYAFSVNPWSTKVSFLHRTVADFLKTSEVHDLLRSRSGDDFDTRVSICRSYLAQVKIMGYTPKPCKQEWTEFRRDELIPGVLINAHDIERTQGRTEKAILDSLAPYLQPAFLQSGCVHFLDLAVRFGLFQYAKECIAVHEDQRKQSLLAALTAPIRVQMGPKFEFVLSSYDDINLDMVQHILDIGVSPNERMGARGLNSCHDGTGETIWSLFLPCLLDQLKPANRYDRSPRCSVSTAFNTLQLLLSYGADPTSREWKEIKRVLPQDKFQELRFTWDKRAGRVNDEDTLIANANGGSKENLPRTRERAQGQNGEKNELAESSSVERCEDTDTQKTTARISVSLVQGGAYKRQQAGTLSGPIKPRSAWSLMFCCGR